MKVNNLASHRVEAALSVSKEEEEEEKPALQIDTMACASTGHGSRDGGKSRKANTTNGRQIVSISAQMGWGGERKSHRHQFIF